jgi:two-component system chemotaxis response regulator CheB
MSSATRVLVAEDSAAVRTILVGILAAASDIEVVGEATTGADAIRLTERLRPDVITMDINMPEIDGLAATEAIMQRTPTPIVIVSSSVRRGDVEMTMRAIQVGALTAIPKPENPFASDFDVYAATLIEMVRSMAQVKVVRRWSAKATGQLPVTAGSPAFHRTDDSNGARVKSPVRTPRVVAIVASTGGPAALQMLFSRLPATLSIPILVVQHIADGFVEAMADWLSRTAQPRLLVAQDGMPLDPGTIYIAPSARQLGVRGDRLALSDAPPVGGFKPSGTYLLRSVTATFGGAAVGVILTGMGRDGVDGLLALHAAGGFTIAQDEATSVVYGMPQEAARAGAADIVLPISEIAGAIAQCVTKGAV